MENVIISLIILNVFIFSMSISQNNTIRKLNNKIEELEEENCKLEYNNATLKQVLLQYKFLYKKKPNSGSPTNIPEGTLEAIKMAMKASHPDNGGKTEDFIKFRRAYKILSERK